MEPEYIFATSSAQMAAKWADMENDGDRYNIQYRTANDDRVRDEHEALANTTLPDTDLFWESYFPPNGWRCRCTAVQVRKGKYPEDNSAKSIAKGETATTRIDKKGNNADEIFRFNPGKQKVIFPPKHPYRQVQDKVVGIIDNIALKTNEEYKARFTEFESLVKNKSYTDVSFDGKTGGLKATHVNHSFDPRRGEYEKDVRDTLYKDGHSVILGQEKFKNPTEGVKHVEGKLNGQTFEIGTSLGTGKNNIKHIFQHCESKKAETALLYFPEESQFNFDRLVKGYAGFTGSSKYEFKNIYYVVGNDVRVLK